MRLSKMTPGTLDWTRYARIAASVSDAQLRLERRKVKKLDFREPRGIGCDAVE
jgi:hypothetical protein